MTATSTYLGLPIRSEDAVRRLRSGQGKPKTKTVWWRLADAADLVDGARVGYRGGYGLLSVHEGRIEGGMARETGDLPSWTVRLDSDGQTRWGYEHQFYVEETVCSAIS